MTGSDFDWTSIDHDQAAAHRASGKPRYSVTLYLVEGGTVCRWSDDRSQAHRQRAAALADPSMDAIVTFDHWLEEPEIFDTRGPRKSRAEAKAELDAAIDAMFARWEAETLH